MNLIFRIFNSVIFAMINVTIMIYICQWITGSRASLDYIGTKISEGIEQMKEDISKELSITDHLTRLSSKAGLLLQHYSELQEEFLELVRMDHNTKSVRIETSADINEEVKTILAVARKKQAEQAEQVDCPRTPKKLKKLTTTLGAKNSFPQNPVAKVLPSQSYDLSDLSMLDLHVSEIEEARSPVYPEVQLLNDARPTPDTKSIGFRPSWQCEA